MSELVHMPNDSVDEPVPDPNQVIAELSKKVSDLEIMNSLLISDFMTLLRNNPDYEYNLVGLRITHEHVNQIVSMKSNIFNLCIKYSRTVNKSNINYFIATIIPSKLKELNKILAYKVVAYNDVAESDYVMITFSVESNNSIEEIHAYAALEANNIHYKLFSDKKIAWEYIYNINKSLINGNTIHIEMSRR